MSGNPWIRFFPSDWLAGTRGMTASESGIYITLIALMYEREGVIENNAPRLSRLCGASNSSFKKALETLIREGKITHEENTLSNNRVVEELSYTREKSSVARQNANSRWGKKHNKNNETPDATAMQPQCTSNANQKPEARVDANASTTRAINREFDDVFWPRYPDKQAKGEAKKAFAKARTKASLDEIMEGLHRYIKNKPEDVRWSYPATWLNKERWTDEPAPAVNVRAPPANPLADAFEDLRREIGTPDEADNDKTLDLTPNA